MNIEDSSVWKIPLWRNILLAQPFLSNWNPQISLESPFILIQSQWYLGVHSAMKWSHLVLRLLLLHRMEWVVGFRAFVQCVLYHPGDPYVCDCLLSFNGHNDTIFHWFIQPYDQAKRRTHRITFQWNSVEICTECTQLSWVHDKVMIW